MGSIAPYTRKVLQPHMRRIALNELVNKIKKTHIRSLSIRGKKRKASNSSRLSKNRNPKRRIIRAKTPKALRPPSIQARRTTRKPKPSKRYPRKNFFLEGNNAYEYM